MNRFYIIFISLILFSSCHIVGIYRAIQFNRIGELVWLEQPEDFEPFTGFYKNDESWSPTDLRILNNKYVAQVGPMRFPNSDLDEYDYYQIQVIKPSGLNKSSSTIPGFLVGELKISLDYIPEDKIKSKASEIVIFDKKTKIMTFDFGKSIFKCRLDR